MIEVFKNEVELSKAAAAFFVRTAVDAVKENGRFTVVLTGGSSPALMYELLTLSPYREQVPWSQTFIFWGDERGVPLTDERSNAKMAFETLLNHVPVPANQIFPMWEAPSTVSAAQAEDIAHAYEQQLRNHFGKMPPRFDLVLLGMGDDGHAASLFPGTPVLNEQSKRVVAYYLGSQSMYRITLSAPLINQAKKIVFIVYGEKKSHALKEVLKGAGNPGKFPAQLIKPGEGEIFWFVDEEAAKEL